jgi:hypothetical protein
VDDDVENERQKYQTIKEEGLWKEEVKDGEEGLYRRSTSIYRRNGVIRTDRNTYPP